MPHTDSDLPDRFVAKIQSITASRHSPTPLSVSTMQARQVCKRFRDVLLVAVAAGPTALAALYWTLSVLGRTPGSYLLRQATYNGASAGVAIILAAINLACTALFSVISPVPDGPGAHPARAVLLVLHTALLGAAVLARRCGTRSVRLRDNVATIAADGRRGLYRGRNALRTLPNHASSVFMCIRRHALQGTVAIMMACAAFRSPSVGRHVGVSQLWPRPFPHHLITALLLGDDISWINDATIVVGLLLTTAHPCAARTYFGVPTDSSLPRGARTAFGGLLAIGRTVHSWRHELIIAAALLSIGTLARVLLPHAAHAWRRACTERLVDAAAEKRLADYCFLDGMMSRFAQRRAVPSRRRYGRDTRCIVRWDRRLRHQFSKWVAGRVWCLSAYAKHCAIARGENTAAHLFVARLDGRAGAGRCNASCRPSHTQPVASLSHNGPIRPLTDDDISVTLTAMMGRRRSDMTRRQTGNGTSRVAACVRTTSKGWFAALRREIEFRACEHDLYLSPVRGDVEGGAHWYLLAFNRATAKCSIFDPLGASSPLRDEQVQLLGKLQRMLATWSVQLCDLPVQTDDVSCGTWILLFCERLLSTFDVHPARCTLPRKPGAAVEHPEMYPPALFAIFRDITIAPGATGATPNELRVQAAYDDHERARATIRRSGANDTMSGSKRRDRAGPPPRACRRRTVESAWQAPAESAFETDPLAALLVFWRTSGLGRFRTIDDPALASPDGIPAFMKDTGHNHPARRALEDEMHDAAAVDTETVERCLRDYNSEIGPSTALCNIYVCGACCRRDFGDAKQRQLHILDALPELRLDATASRRHRELPERVSACTNVFVSDSHSRFYAAPQHVVYDDRNRPCIQLCVECAHHLKTRHKVPTYSIAAGCDYGDIVAFRKAFQLEPLTDWETLLIAPIRTITHVRQLVAPKGTDVDSGALGLTGHSICFQHEGPDVIATQLPRLSLDTLVSVMFVGSRQQWNRHRPSLLGPAGRRHGIAPVNGERVFRWVKALKDVGHPQYANIEILEPTADRLAALNRTADAVLDNVVIASDPITRNIHDRVVSDVAQNRPEACDQDFAEGAGSALNSVYITNRSPVTTDSSVQMVLRSASLIVKDLVRSKTTDGSAQRTQTENSGIQADASHSNGNACSETDISEQDEDAAPNRRWSTTNDSISDSENLITGAVEGASPVNARACASPAQPGSHDDSDTMSWFSDSDTEPVPMTLDDEPAPATVLQVHSAADPMNEFTSNDTLLTGAFPSLFFLGKGVPFTGTPPRAWTRFLMLQACNRFATSNALVFLLFDQIQRHAACASVAAKARNDPEAFRKLRALVEDPSFQRQLGMAERAPNSATARALRAKLVPLLRLTGRTVPFGPLERGAALSRLYSLVHYHGAPSWFLTVAPADLHSPLVVRLASTDPREPDAKPAELEVRCLQSYKDRAELVAMNPVAASLVYAKLIDALCKNLLGLQPQHATKKTELPSNRRRALFGKCCGYFGTHEAQGRGTMHLHLIYFGGLMPRLLQRVAECPALARRAGELIDSAVSSSLPERHHVRLAAGRGFVEVPPGEGLQQEFPWPCKDTAVDWEQFHEFAYNVVARSNMHSHKETCHHGVAGQTYCRMCRPMPTQPVSDIFKRNPKFRPIQLRIPESEDAACPHSNASGALRRPRPACALEPLAEITNWTPHCSALHGPIEPLDTRVIAWELQRPILDRQRVTEATAALRPANAVAPATGPRKLPADDANGMVVEYSPGIAVATGSNQCAMPLGSCTQARQICHYILKVCVHLACSHPPPPPPPPSAAAFPPVAMRFLSHLALLLLQYVCKETYDLTSCLPLVNAARRAVAARPSGASDSGTSDRTSKHLLTSILNRIGAKNMEVSAQMAACMLLGMESTVSTHRFWYAFPWNAVRYARGGDTAAGLCPSEDEQDDSDIDDARARRDQRIDLEYESSADDESPPDVSHNVEDMQAEPDATAGKQREGGANVYTVDGRLIFVSPESCFAHRGPRLAMYNMFEYTGIVSVERVPKKTSAANGRDNKTGRRGRCNNLRIPFLPGHPLHGHYEQCLRSKQCVPMMGGKPPPRAPVAPSTAGSTSSQRKHNARFAQYYLTMFLPWSQADVTAHEPDSRFGQECDGDSEDMPSDDRHCAATPRPRLDLSYARFCAWSDAVRHRPDQLGPSDTPLPPDAPLAQRQLWAEINYCRLRCITNMCSGLAIDNQHRRMLSQFRRRCATRWADRGPLKPDSRLAFAGPDDADLGECNTAAVDALMDQLRVAQGVDAATLRDGGRAKTRCFTDRTLATLDRLMGPSEAAAAARANSSSVPCANRQARPAHVMFTAHAVTTVAKTIRSTPAADGDEPGGVPSGDARILGGQRLTTAELDARLSALAATAKLDADQVPLFWDVLRWLHGDLQSSARRTAPPPALRLFIHGSPGVGKSHFVRVLMQGAQQLQLQHGIPATSTLVACAAFSGVAASIIGGRTLHSLLGIPVAENKQRHSSDSKWMTPPSHDVLCAVRHRLAATRVLVVDEVSLVSPAMLAHISQRLQQIRGNTIPFGGLSVILMGDCFQIDPVAVKKPLHSACVTPTEPADVGHPAGVGTDLFRSFIKREFTINHRIDEADAEHIRCIHTCLRSTASAPITTEFIQKLRILDADTVSKDPTWLDAIFVVTSNPERHAINSRQAVAFARRNGLPVLVWRHAMANHATRTIDQAEQDTLLYDAFPELFGVFVCGAPCHLTDRNICPEKQLANGASAKMHSLTYASPSQQLAVQRAIDAAQPGEIVLVPHPLSINVELPMADTSIPASDTLLSGRRVIPVTLTKNKTVDTGGGPLGYSALCVSLAFACTFHKIQGRTITSKLVLDLSYRPGNLFKLTYPMLYVGFSRVQHSDNLRIMPPRFDVPGHCAFGHLRKMSAHSDLKRWLASYDADGVFHMPTPSALPRRSSRRTSLDVASPPCDSSPPRRGEIVPAGSESLLRGRNLTELSQPLTGRSARQTPAVPVSGTVSSRSTVPSSAPPTPGPHCSPPLPLRMPTGSCWPWNTGIPYAPPQLQAPYLHPPQAAVSYAAVTVAPPHALGARGGPSLPSLQWTTAVAGTAMPFSLPVVPSTAAASAFMPGLHAPGASAGISWHTGHAAVPPVLCYPAPLHGACAASDTTQSFACGTPSSTQTRTTQAMYRPVGLENALRKRSNSCFMNAVIQGLARLPCVVDAILKSRSNCPASCHDGGLQCSFHCKLQLLLRQSRDASISTQHTVLKHSLYLSIRQVHAQFTPKQQQDCQEFLTKLLEHLDPTGAQDGITALFQLSELERTSSRCPNIACQRVPEPRSAVTTLVHLFVDPVASNQSVANGWFHRMQYTLGDGDREDTWYRCDACHQRYPVILTCSVTRTPAVLALCLKRFDACGRKVAAPVANNLTLFVECAASGAVSSGALRTPLDRAPHARATRKLSAAPYGRITPHAVASPAQHSAHADREHVTRYTLQCVVQHIGPTLHSGHYISYVRGIRDGEWWRADDETTTPVTSDVVERAEGYLLFYTRSYDA